MKVMQFIAVSGRKVRYNGISLGPHMLAETVAGMRHCTIDDSTIWTEVQSDRVVVTFVSPTTGLEIFGHEPLGLFGDDTVQIKLNFTTYSP